jgi:choline dehydrogenase-like flavoprotein
MLVDLEREAAGGTYSSEVCVLGAGIAGLVLARGLAGRGFKVHLLEAGGLELEERSQRLYAAEMAGDRHVGASEGRFRVFGGSSTRWGGQLLPFTEDIFSPGAGMPSHAWPIGGAAIERYYAEVLAIMGADALPFGGELLGALGLPAVAFGDGVRLRFSKWAPFGRRNLANSLGRECIGHERVTVFTHANAMAVNLDEAGGRVESATVKNYAGASFKFQAEQFVVCLGTIESSRLLLASVGRDQRGVGNAHDQVGRYFHDHVGMRMAEIAGAARARVLERLGPFYVENTLHTCKLEASAELREREGLPAVMAHVVIEEPEDSGAAALRNLLGSVQRGKLKQAVVSNLGPMLRGLGDVARLAWDSRVRRRRAVSARARVGLKIDLEQVARADDRIRLGDARDALGQRKAVVDWRIGDEERAAARAYARLVKAELEGVGIAGLEWVGLDAGGGAPAMEDTFHPMGGLRMGEDARSSVVDRELKVHGVKNLHVASCAVFPAGGSSNPTFTMMALTLRLADRLADPSGDA